MKILACGDSITFAENVDPPNRWTDLVQAAMPQHEVINKGVCGDTTRLGLERFPADVQQLFPDCLILQFGLNDANRWKTDNGLPRVSPDAFTANLCEMVQRGRIHGATHIGIIALTPATKPSVNPQWWRYMGAIKSACEKSHADYIPHSMKIDRTEFLQPDGVHLNEAGNREIADAVLAWLGPLQVRSNLMGVFQGIAEAAA